MRSALNGLYTGAGVLAALSLLAILLLVIAQMVARWMGLLLPGGASYAGYAMAASSFLGMAYTFVHNEHIRVGLFVDRSGNLRRGFEIWCYGIATAIVLYFAWYAIQAPILSHRFNDVSQGQDATPLWIPQLSMAVGVSIMAIAVVDTLLKVLLTDSYGIDPPREMPERDALAKRRQRLILLGAFLLVVYGAMRDDRPRPRRHRAENRRFPVCLFFLLGSGVWVGLALMGVAYMGMIGHPAIRSSMSITIWTGRQAGRSPRSAVHMDGRNPVSHAALRGYVQGAGTLAVPSAGRIAAYECRWLHGVRGGVRLICGDADDSWQDVHPRAAQARLSRIHDYRHAGRRGDAGADDSAFADADRLRGDGEGEYHQPGHGRGSAGARAGFDVHALYRRVVDCASAGQPSQSRGWVSSALRARCC